MNNPYLNILGQVEENIESTEYSVMDIQLNSKDKITLICDTENVWPPYSAPKTLQKLVEVERFATTLKNRGKVLDFGSGSGPYGVACLKLGASETIMVDNNHYASQLSYANAIYNGFNEESVKAFTATELSEIENHTFDLIVTNPPHNPADAYAENIGATHAMKSNQTDHPDGRGVIDMLIEQGATYLNSNGTMYITCSSKNDWGAIYKLLIKYWGEYDHSWSFIDQSINKVDLGYHGRFIKHWRQMHFSPRDEATETLRVFFLDQLNNRYDISYVKDLFGMDSELVKSADHIIKVQEKVHSFGRRLILRTEQWTDTNNVQKIIESKYNVGDLTTEEIDSGMREFKNCMCESKDISELNYEYMMLETIKQ